MTRLEELTFNLADDAITDAECQELHIILAGDLQAWSAHINILQIEAALRAQRQDLDLVEPVMKSLRSTVADSVARTVMTQIKTRPVPNWRRKRVWLPWKKPFPFFASGIRLPLARACLPTAICLILAAGFGVWYFNPTIGEPALADVQGSGLILERAGERFPAGVGVRLQPGDVLRTPEHVTAVIGYAPENTRVKVLPGTELTLTTSSRGKLFALGLGKLEATVSRQTPFRPMIIATQQAQARVVGTRFTLLVTNNSTRLDVMEGKVRFTRLSDEKFVQVNTGHYAVAAADYELASLPFTGNVLREWWSGVKGKNKMSLPNDPRFPYRPNGHDLVPDFEVKVAETNQFGMRVCGYIHPPVTGGYRFWLESPPTDFKAVGYAALLMSPTENPADAVEIAQTGGSGMMFGGTISPYISGDSTTKAPPPIPLVAGRRYYFEARMVVEHGAGNLSVFWQPSGQDREVLSSKYLSPWKPE
jgi:FecR protein